jgi:homocitrate synthase NifV
LPIEFHAHNDFGLAIANTVCALQSGARYASVTASGIGERAGNAALEDVLAVLVTTHSVPPGINLTAAKKIGCQVAAISDRRALFQDFTSLDEPARC